MREPRVRLSTRLLLAAGASLAWLAFFCAVAAALRSPSRFAYLIAPAGAACTALCVVRLGRALRADAEKIWTPAVAFAIWIGFDFVEWLLSARPATSVGFLSVLYVALFAVTFAASYVPRYFAELGGAASRPARGREAIAPDQPRSIHSIAAKDPPLASRE